jgi:hypothetical protein
MANESGMGAVRGKRPTTIHSFAWNQGGLQQNQAFSRLATPCALR